MTVTSVDTSPDLRHARVYVSVLGSEEERSDSLEGLAASHGFLQARVNEELHMKRTPRLQFVYDDSVDRGMRISELIEKAAQPAEPAACQQKAAQPAKPAARPRHEAE